MVDIQEYATSKSSQNRFGAIYSALPDDVSSILNIGCARYNREGREGEDLHGFLTGETEAEIKGIDINERGIKQMKEEGYDVMIADAQTFDFEEKFDAIVAGEVIEYLPNPGTFVDNALKHLSATGRLIITTENPRAFAYWRSAIRHNSIGNVVWIDADNIHGLSSLLDEEDVEIEWLPPIGGVSGILWRLGYKKAAAPRYCAAITLPEKQTESN